ncbi:MAG: hypothetical protein R3212_01420 [Xanthomonadales bacterium]|nr:hypothetical protein [Xanthomonadales bacterium]
MRLAALTGVLLIVSCATTSGMDKARTEALEQYESMIRWSQWDGAVNYIAPEYLEENPITRLDLERLRLFRVTAYTVRSTQVYDEGKTLTQGVEIRLFHKSQAVERTIYDDQLWKYDEEAQVWMLHSGLPDPTQRN